jgi:hypothetical protein
LPHRGLPYLQATHPARPDAEVRAQTRLQQPHCPLESDFTASIEKREGHADAPVNGKPAAR